jgi:hypothetical protein
MFEVFEHEVWYRYKRQFYEFGLRDLCFSRSDFYVVALFMLLKL